MTTIKAKNKAFTGTQFGVAFVNGVGETEDEYLISRFKNKGYDIEEEEPKKKAPKQATTKSDA